MIKHIEDLMFGLSKTDKTGFSDHTVIIPVHFLNDVLQEVVSRWVIVDDPWQKYDQMWHAWRGSLPINTLQYLEHPKDHATVRVWRTRIYSNGAVHHDRAVYSYISVLQHGLSKTVEDWIVELSNAVEKQDLTYQALIPCAFVNEVLGSIDAGPIRVSASFVHNYSTGDSSRMVPSGYQEVSLCYWPRDNDPIIKGYWLAPWMDITRKHGVVI